MLSICTKKKKSRIKIKDVINANCILSRLFNALGARAVGIAARIAKKKIGKNIKSIVLFLIKNDF